jgi:hypothetical protein
MTTFPNWKEDTAMDKQKNYPVEALLQSRKVKET